MASGIRSGICSFMCGGMGTTFSTAANMSGITLGIIPGMRMGNSLGIMGRIMASMAPRTPGEVPFIHFIMAGKGLGMASIISGKRPAMNPAMASGLSR